MHFRSLWISALAGLALVETAGTLAPASQLAAQTSPAGSTTITGRVISQATGLGVPNVTVTVASLGMTSTTDLSGNFSIPGVPAGSADLIAVRSGFQTSTITGVATTADVIARVEIPLNPAGQDDVLQMEAFTISADIVENSQLGLLSVRQRAAGVSDAIGSDQMSKLGFGNAASAMKAVTGASVVGGKYVFVRGLGDRYSSTMVNGVEAPSADPDRKVVNMDMFPSDLIDAIVTTKTFTPDKPGNFTGGSVNMKTKDFPEEFAVSVSVSFAHNSEITGEPFLDAGGGNTWGKDDGERALPAELADRAIPLRFSTATVDAEIGRLTRLFDPQMSPGVKEAPYNRSFSLALGGSTPLFGRKLGFAASLSYDRNYSGYTSGRTGRYERQGVNSPSLSPLVEMSDWRSEDEALIGSLFNVAYQFSGEHQVGFTAMLNQSGTNMARRQSGLNVSGGGISETETFTTRTLRYTERSLESFQLSGKHLFPEWRETRVEWNATRATTTQEEPDTRYFSTFATPGGSQFFEASGLPRPARFYRELEESRDDFGLDVTVPISAWGGRDASLKFGGAYNMTEREFSERLFEYNSTALLYDGNENQFLRESQVGQVDPATNRFRTGQLYLIEKTSLGNSYLGEQEIVAAYAMVDLPVTDQIRVITGVRRETTTLDVRSRDPLRRPGTLDNDDYLPSLNAVYALSEKMNLRAAVTKTLARPNVREIADYTSFEFVGDFVYVGNPELRRTTIRNYDLRWEWFPQPGELIAVSAFYKEMKDPIERGVFSIVNSGELQYQNAPEGKVMGLEFEARKPLDFLGDWAANLSGGANYTVVESEVQITPAERQLIQFYDAGAGDTRELTGQSPYVANVDLSYSRAESGTTVSLYYNIFGARLSQVSPPGTPNVFEQPAPTLDLVWSQRLMSRWKMTVSAKNLLNEESEETYSYRGVDYLRASSRRGISTSVGVSFSY